MRQATVSLPIQAGPALLCALLLWACGEIAPETSYFPLSKGHHWQYTVDVVTSQGRSTQKYYLRNLGEREVRGRRVWARADLQGREWYYEQNRDGVYYLGASEPSGRTPTGGSHRQRIFPARPALDMEWEETTRTRLLEQAAARGGDAPRRAVEVPVSSKVIALDETVRVPAGTFRHCLKLRRTGSTFENVGKRVGAVLLTVNESAWYARGVGLVRLERTEEAHSALLPAVRLTLELASFGR